MRENVKWQFKIGSRQTNLEEQANFSDVDQFSRGTDWCRYLFLHFYLICRFGLCILPDVWAVILF